MRLWIAIHSDCISRWFQIQVSILIDERVRSDNLAGNCPLALLQVIVVGINSIITDLILIILPMKHILSVKRPLAM